MILNDKFDWFFIKKILKTEKENLVSNGYILLSSTNVF